MSRGVRLEKEGMLYHIICRGQRKEPLFFSRSDMNKYCQIVNYCLTQYDVEIVAYCIMRNHVHLLVRRGTLPIADFMHRLNTIYAVYFNKKYLLAGHVFQGRYKAFPVLKKKYYYSVINYIHDNPKRAGLVSKQWEYAYSSAYLYYGKQIKSAVIKISKYAGDENIIDKIEEKYNYTDCYIGTKNEYKQLSKRRTNISSPHCPERRKDCKIPILKMFDIICRKKGIHPEDMKKKWKREIILIRNEIILELYIRGYSQTSIGNLLNLSRKSVNRILKRLQK